MEKYVPRKWPKKNAGVAIIIYDKTDFNTI